MTPLKVKTVTELQREASAIVDSVIKGEQVVITKNGKPVAIMQRVSEQDLSFDKPKKK